MNESGKRASTLSGCFRSVLGLKVDLSAPVLRDLFCAPSVWRSKHKAKHPVFGKRVRHTAWQSHVCALMYQQTRAHTQTHDPPSVSGFSPRVHQKPSEERPVIMAHA